jgi:DNA-binding transcriptional LysR family regulator
VSKVLDITPLRSLIAIADNGGFHRAAASLALTQSAVSQHVRRLETVVGRPLVERDGRRTRFTAAGELLVAQARLILDAHDDALRRLEITAASQLIVGVTEHAADLILPPIIDRLGASFPELDVQFRFDRTRRLSDAVDQGSIDIAVFVAEASERPGEPIGSLPLQWCSAPGWEPPADGTALSLVAIEAPCAIRSIALRVLAAADVPVRVTGEAAYLAGVHNAARAGLGVALLAMRGPSPEGLVERLDLPSAPSISLAARIREGADPEVTETVMDVLRSTLSTAAPALPV